MVFQPRDWQHPLPHSLWNPKGLSILLRIPQGELMRIQRAAYARRPRQWPHRVALSRTGWWRWSELWPHLYALNLLPPHLRLEPPLEYNPLTPRRPSAPEDSSLPCAVPCQHVDEQAELIRSLRAKVKRLEGEQERSRAREERFNRLTAFRAGEGGVTITETAHAVGMVPKRLAKIAAEAEDFPRRLPPRRERQGKFYSRRPITRYPRAQVYAWLQEHPEVVDWERPPKKAGAAPRQ